MQELAAHIAYKIGYQFKETNFLERAITHSSLTGTQDQKKEKIHDLERLEFLGDRVLGLMTAEALWRAFPKMSEGEMAPRLNAMVRKETCAKAAKAIGLGPFIRMTKSEEEAGGRDKTAILGDVCEAIIGALYVDGGLPAAKQFFDAYWGPNFDHLANHYKDAKTVLQEWSQEQGLGTPKYIEIKRTGPAHCPEFLIEVQLRGQHHIQAKGNSKRDAQMKAAKAFLIEKNLWPED